MVSKNKRIYYLDYIRVILAALVITVHVAISYSPEVWWFFKSKTLNHIWYLYYYEIISTFCMGFFFLISGYFMVPMYKKRGGNQLIKNRSKFCLMVIVLGVFMIIMPLHYIYHVNYRTGVSKNFFDYIVNVFFGINGRPSGWNDKWLEAWPDFKFAHLWFMQHILMYTIFYVLVMKGVSFLNIKKKSIIEWKSSYLAWCVVILSCLTFAVRIFYPLDYWGALFGFIQTEYANLPKYVLCIICGILLYSYGLLDKIPKRTGLLCFGTGITLLIIALSGSIQISFIAAKGGWTYQSLVWSVFESVMSICLYIGVVVLCREFFNKKNEVVSTLAKATFGVYLFHVPIVVLIQFALVNLQTTLVIKFIIECVLGICLSFIISIGLGRVSESFLNVIKKHTIIRRKLEQNIERGHVQS